MISDFSSTWLPPTCSRASFLLQSSSSTTFSSRQVFIQSYPTKNPCGIRSHDPLLHSPRWLEETIPHLTTPLGQTFSIIQFNFLNRKGRFLTRYPITFQSLSNIDDACPFWWHVYVHYICMPGGLTINWFRISICRAIRCLNVEQQAETRSCTKKKLARWRKLFSACWLWSAPFRLWLQAMLSHLKESFPTRWKFHEAILSNKCTYVQNTSWYVLY